MNRRNSASSTPEDILSASEEQKANDHRDLSRFSINDLDTLEKDEPSLRIALDALYKSLCDFNQGFLTLDGKNYQILQPEVEMANTGLYSVDFEFSSNHERIIYGTACNGVQVQLFSGSGSIPKWLMNPGNVKIGWGIIQDQKLSQRTWGCYIPNLSDLQIFFKGSKLPTKVKEAGEKKVIDYERVMDDLIDVVWIYSETSRMSNAEPIKGKVVSRPMFELLWGQGINPTSLMNEVSQRARSKLDVETIRGSTATIVRVSIRMIFNGFDETLTEETESISPQEAKMTSMAKLCRKISHPEWERVRSECHSARRLGFVEYLKQRKLSLKAVGELMCVVSGKSCYNLCSYSSFRKETALEVFINLCTFGMGDLDPVRDEEIFL